MGHDLYYIYKKHGIDVTYGGMIYFSSSSRYFARVAVIYSSRARMLSCYVPACLVSLRPVVVICFILEFVKTFFPGMNGLCRRVLGPGKLVVQLPRLFIRGVFSFRVFPVSHRIRISLGLGIETDTGCPDEVG